MFVKVFTLILICFTVAVLTDKSCKHARNHQNFHLLPDEEICGKHLAADRIMHGRAAQYGEFPWMAQIIYKLPFPITVCGGSIINNKYIVTAAHCLNKISSPDSLYIRLGALEVFKSWYSLSPAVEDYEVEEIITNKLYSARTDQNDIGLVRVAGEIEFGAFISPICLPTTCSIMLKNFTGVTLSTMGWGNVEEVPEEKTAEILQSAHVKVSPLHECKERWMALERIEIVSSQICARGVHGESPCHGDSGGPLVGIDHDTALNVIVGVVSLGDVCNSQHSSNTPAVFTRVSSFVPWILDQLRE